MRTQYTDDFLEFWRAYPRKVGKKVAFESWCRLLKEGYTAQEIVHGAKCEALDRKAEDAPPRFIPHASTWLNQCRFEDYAEREIPVYRELTDEEKWLWQHSRYSNHPRALEGKPCLPPDRDEIKARYAQ